jgi:hypothetical protein
VPERLLLRKIFRSRRDVCPSGRIQIFAAK